MNRDAPLPAFRLDRGANLAQASPWRASPVTLESPALEVMTDLTLVKAATVAPEQTLAQAEQTMRYLGVRMLFVVSRMPELLGLVTSHDLHGERQMRLVHERGAPFDELRVADVMVPLAELEAIEYERVAAATVGNLVATLKRFGRHHVLVVEPAEAGAAPVRVRGVVSRAQIERQLGQPVAVTEIARSFSEIERALI
jgi:CBS-domain-containing membrane protein